MNYLPSEALDLTIRLLARSAVAAAALLLVAPSIPGAAESDGNAQPAPQCRTHSLATGEGEAGPSYPAVDASIPGWWRQELALDSPHPRVPGTLTILPQGSAPAEVSTESR